ncbi:hypothetical protein [Mucilaginibacter segetis]|nr:hypothetical protein [Mucilaginibacter segetis]
MVRTKKSVLTNSRMSSDFALRISVYAGYGLSFSELQVKHSNSP